MYTLAAQLLNAWLVLNYSNPAQLILDINFFLLYFPQYRVSQFVKTLRKHILHLC